MDIPSLNHLFLNACDRFQKRDAFKIKQNGVYTDISHAVVAERVEHLSRALVTLGIKPGDRVAILSENRLEWALADYGILTARAINVPIYPTLPDDQVAHILENSGAKLLFVSTPEQLAKVGRIRAQLDDLEHVVVFDRPDGNGDETRTAKRGFVTFDDVLERGAIDARKHPHHHRLLALKAKPDEPATIIYTSGTTGVPKGVVLSHGNITSNVLAVADILPFDRNDTGLSFLPLSHILERMAGHFTMFHKGTTIAYAESIDTVQPNMLEVRPTIMISVPRLYEKIHARVTDMVASSPPLRRKIFHWALGVGWEAAQLRMQGKPVTGFLAWKNALASRLVFQKLQARTGGRLRFFVSGGAPLSPDVARFFFAAGFTIYEGYGLTETSPVLTVNRPDGVKLGTVGPAVPGVELKIAGDGEILARGPNVMRGYYKNEEATREVLDEDGWFHTGDIGTLDEHGYLQITDRKKDLIVTAGGKNIAPQPIENLLKTSPLVAEAVLIGDRRKFVSAILVPAFEQLEAVVKDRGIAGASRTDLCRHPEVIQLFQDEVDRLCGGLASYERPKKVALVEKEFSIESGELTPTMKVKRRIVNERCAELIDTLYREG